MIVTGASSNASLNFSDAKAKRDLSTLQAIDIARFRDREAKELSRSTANLSMKVLRVCFTEAVRQGLLAVNPALRVKLLKSARKVSVARSRSRKSNAS